MKPYKTLITAFLLLSTSLFAQKYPTLNIGQEMPMQDTEIFDVNEKSRTLSKNLKRNGILVVFTSNSCPFVVMWEDRYKLLEEKCMNSDLGMVYINSNQAKRDGDDSIEKMKKHSIKMGYTFPYLIDKNRKKVLVYKGAIDDNYNSINDVTKNYLLDAMQEVSDQKGVSVSETKAVGCSIKRVKK